ncbi:bifunctional 3-(3-hydroxy-phenyl)propionate/3-hydroxycinnamic acid hydroxylase [Actinoplanes sp. NPDC026670]|uniref:bifunctional 3-(3-hydroxy-phenyl)propionate/3-hydroxycinnamic acid hydroxylase n=1 Tax=Actinoplanes sp. NPDC026670 TaxID=3154700 RepID=UPI0033C9771A
MNHYDVAVIGYGPVGATAANLLGRLGLRVLVLERDPDIYARARAISTDEEVIRIWQRVGLAEQLTADMLADLPLTFVDAAGRTFLQFTPQTYGNGYHPQWFIYQPALERTLREGVRRYPNVEVRLGHECTDLRQDAAHVTVTFREADGEQQTAYATYVIAADGGSSPTRTRLGIGFEGRTYEDRWVVIDTKVIEAWPEIGRLRFHCDPARPAVDCPTPLGHHRWEFPVLPGDDETFLTSTDGVYQLLARHGISSAQVEVLRAVVYSHHVRFAARWRSGRIFLAGDAAHVMPPWIGEGMASGVRDVENLCWKLATVLAGNGSTESILGSYETERMPHVRAMTKAAVAVGRIITERRRHITAVRDPLVRTVMRLPGIGTFLQNGSWFPTTRYRDGLLANSGPRRAIGAHAPQPWVLDEYGHRTRLDDALGHLGWAVLQIGPGPRAGQQAWRDAGVRVLDLRAAGSDPGPGALVDIDNVLIDWAFDRKVTALALRPDAIVYAATSRGRELPPPPAPQLPPLRLMTEQPEQEVPTP